MLTVRSQQHRITAIDAGTRRPSWKLMSISNIPCTSLSKSLTSHCISSPCTSLQFDPCPRAGEPMVSRRMLPTPLPSLVQLLTFDFTDRHSRLLPLNSLSSRRWSKPRRSAVIQTRTIAPHRWTRAIRLMDDRASPAKHRHSSSISALIH